MSSKLDTLDAVIYGAGLLLFIGLMASVICSVLTDTAANTVTNKVTDKVTNEVVNNTANRVTTIETEVYRVVCVEEKSGYCKEYSVRKINRE